MCHEFNNVSIIKFYKLKGEKMLKKKLINSKGITGTDAIIAIFLISLFTGIIATLSYNIYVSSTFTNRSVQANQYVIDFFEYVDRMEFEVATTENLVKYINDKNDSKISAKQLSDANNLTTPYKMEINVELYPEDRKMDLVKIVSISLSYKIANKEQKIEIQRVKAKDA